MLSTYVRYGHYERFVYQYEYVYFAYSYLDRIVDLDGNVTGELRNCGKSGSLLVAMDNKNHVENLIERKIFHDLEFKTTWRKIVLTKSNAQIAKRTLSYFQELATYAKEKGALWR